MAGKIEQAIRANAGLVADAMLVTSAEGGAAEE